MSRSAMTSRALVLGLMLAAGGWLRLRHLGDSGLVADEGHQV